MEGFVGPKGQMLNFHSGDYMGCLGEYKSCMGLLFSHMGLLLFDLNFSMRTGDTQVVPS